MAARSKARRRALDILFEADLRGTDPLDSLAAMQDRRAAEGSELSPYTSELVTGVAEQSSQIEDTIGRYAIGWTLSRMPVVDRNVLRIGVWELLFNPQIDDGVAISEAKKLVAELSTDQSPDFVQGVLGRVASMRDTEQAAIEEPIVIEPVVVRYPSAEAPIVDPATEDSDDADRWPREASDD